MRARAAFALVAVLAGCSFPDVTLQSTDAAAPVDGSAPVDAALDAQPPPDDGYSLEGAADVIESTGDGEAGGKCDQDHDTYLAESTCGADDCDDTDPRANPGVTTYLTDMPTTTNPLPGDWNCNHILELQYPINFSCSTVTTNCNTAQGFSDAPGCGSTGTFVTCTQPLLGGCTTNTTSNTVAQGCK
jgi:hypothetical protein